jgi:hypothetical protein
MIAASGFDNEYSTTSSNGYPNGGVTITYVYRYTTSMVTTPVGPRGCGRPDTKKKLPWFDLSLARPEEVSVEPPKKDQGVFEPPFSLWAPSGRAPRYGPN